MIFRKVFFLFLAAFLFTAQNAFAESSPNERAAISAKIGKNLPGYSFYNVTPRASTVFFFAFDPRNEKIPFAWYRLDTKRSLAKPKILFSSSEFSLLFQVAFSEDGKTAVSVSKTGEVVKVNLKKTKSKTRMGVSTKRFSGVEFATYLYPAFTPDGNFLLLHNPWENSLLLLPAKENDLNKGIVIPDFWLTEGGSDLPPSGMNISVYEFFEEGKKLRFGQHQILNLETFMKGTPAKLHFYCDYKFLASNCSELVSVSNLIRHPRPSQFSLKNL